MHNLNAMAKGRLNLRPRALLIQTFHTMRWDDKNYVVNWNTWGTSGNLLCSEVMKAGKALIQFKKRKKANQFTARLQRKFGAI